MTDYQDEPALNDKPDTTSMTGAEFRRHVGADPAEWAEAFLAVLGADPAEWAEAFLAVYDEAFLRAGDDPLIDREERAGFTAAWFRDYREAVRSEHTALGRLEPRPVSGRAWQTQSAPLEDTAHDAGTDGRDHQGPDEAGRGITSRNRLIIGRNNRSAII